MRQPMILVVLVGILAGISSDTTAGVPATLSHQGAITVRGERFTGDGAFRFALVDAAANTYLWVNDGSGVMHPNPPAQAVILQVVNGVYLVQIGDDSYTNMTVLPDGVFSANHDVVLRVWFDDRNGGGNFVLTPDVPISTVPFSQHASASEQLNVPGTDTPAATVDGDAHVRMPAGLSVDTDTLVVDETTSRVGIGVLAPGAKLDVAGAIRTDDLETSGVVSGGGFSSWDRNEADDVTMATELSGDVSGTFDTTEVADDSHVHTLATLQIAWAGVVAPFAGPPDRIPVGWLLCDGREVSSDDYPDLYAAIGTSWGSSNPLTVFNLPDLRGQFLRGVDGTPAPGVDPDRNTRQEMKPGGNTGNTVGSLQLDATAHPNDQFGTNETGDHSHSYIESGVNNRLVADGTSFNVNRSNFFTDTGSSGNHSHAVTTGGDLETRPVNAYVNWIIKY